MNINRHNYEEFFLLYIDNELNSEERKAVEAFIEANPDLECELEALSATMLPVENITMDKSGLFRSENPINETNYENYFVQYGDDELSEEEKEYTEDFVYKNPRYQHDFELILKARLTPDNSIVYPDKESLYRSEASEERPVFYMRWARYAAAAVIGVAAIVTWKAVDNPSADGTVYAVNPTAPITPSQPENQNTTEETNTASAGNTANIAEEIHSSNRADYAKNNFSEKTSSSSNFQTTTYVTLSENGTEADFAIAPKKVAVKDNLLIRDNPSIALEEIAENLENSSFALHQNVLASNDAVTASSDFGSLEIADHKKNEFRGVFRKATRIFERVANKESDMSREDKVLSIASFDIALK